MVLNRATWAVSLLFFWAVPSPARSQDFEGTYRLGGRLLTVRALTENDRRVGLFNVVRRADRPLGRMASARFSPGFVYSFDESEGDIATGTFYFDRAQGARPLSGFYVAYGSKKAIPVHFVRKP